MKISLALIVCGLFLVSGAVSAGDAVVSVPFRGWGPDFSAAATAVSETGGLTRTAGPDISWSMLDAPPGPGGYVNVIIYDAPDEVVKDLRGVRGTGRESSAEGP